MLYNFWKIKQVGFDKMFESYCTEFIGVNKRKYLKYYQFFYESQRKVSIN